MCGSPEQTDAVVAAIDAALADAELSIDELDEAVIAGAGSWAGQRIMPALNCVWPRWRQAMATAAHRGALCFGPNRGRTITYTSPRRWLPGFQPAARDTALAGVVRRYLHAYGPATAEHFAQWLGAPRRWATDVFASRASELQQVEVEGTRAWVVDGDNVAPAAPPRSVRLLPYFDAYVVGCQPRELLYPRRAATRALTSSSQAGNYPVLLIDGIVAGVWHLRRTGRTLAITIEPFDSLTTTSASSSTSRWNASASSWKAHPS